MAFITLDSVPFQALITSTRLNTIHAQITDGLSDGTKDITMNDATFNQLDVDNININGNTIISTDTDGDINITPNGSGETVITNLDSSPIGANTPSTGDFTICTTDNIKIDGNTIESTAGDIVNKTYTGLVELEPATNGSDILMADFGKCLQDKADGTHTLFTITGTRGCMSGNIYVTAVASALDDHSAVIYHFVANYDSQLLLLAVGNATSATDMSDVNSMTLTLSVSGTSSTTKTISVVINGGGGACHIQGRFIGIINNQNSDAAIS